MSHPEPQIRGHAVEERGSSWFCRRCHESREHVWEFGNFECTGVPPEYDEV